MFITSIVHIQVDKEFTKPEGLSKIHFVHIDIEVYIDIQRKIQRLHYLTDGQKLFHTPNCDSSSDQFVTK